LVEAYKARVGAGIKAATEERWWMSGDSDVDDKRGSCVKNDGFSVVQKNAGSGTYECSYADSNPDDIHFRQSSRLLHQRV
jgi:hypothetical protein